MNFKTFLAATVLIVTCQAMSPKQFAIEMAKREKARLVLLLAKANMEDNSRKARYIRSQIKVQQTIILLSKEKSPE